MLCNASLETKCRWLLVFGIFFVFLGIFLILDIGIKVNNFKRNIYMPSFYVGLVSYQKKFIVNVQSHGHSQDIMFSVTLV